MTHVLLMPAAAAPDLVFALESLHLQRPLVVALPAGMTTACRIAQALDAPFDVLVGTAGHESSVGEAPGAIEPGPSRLQGRSVVLADDGEADIPAWAEALQALHAMGPDTLVLAAPRLQPAVARWLAQTIGCGSDAQQPEEACCAT